MRGDTYHEKAEDGRDTGFCSVIVLSKTARDAFSPSQLATIMANSDLIATLDISTIEKIGGGSARCMLAEVFTD